MSDPGIAGEALGGGVAQARRMRAPLLDALALLVVLAVAELVGLGLGWSFGIVLAPASPILVVLGLAAGIPALAVGLLRRRAGAAAGGVSDGDLLVHAVLLVNAVLLVGACAGRAAVPGDAGGWLAASEIGTAGVALLGIPASVVCSWRRAFRPPGRRRRDVAVRLSHTVHLAMAGVLLAPAFEPLRTGLIGSLLT